MGRVKMLITLAPWDREKKPRLIFKIHGRATIHLLRAGINAMDNHSYYLRCVFISTRLAQALPIVPSVFQRVTFSSFSTKGISAVVHTAHKQMIPAPIWHGRGVCIVQNAGTSS